MENQIRLNTERSTRNHYTEDYRDGRTILKRAVELIHLLCLLSSGLNHLMKN